MKHWLHEERDAHVLGLMRVAFSSLLLLFTLKQARHLLSGGYFGDVFHLPLLPQAWVPPAAVYALMLTLAGVGCVLSVVGVWARPALLGAGLLHFYAFFCDRLQYHNNRYTLLLVACLVAFTPCDRSFLLWPKLRGARALGAAERIAPRFFVRAVGAQLSLVYLSSSIGKAFDADWRGGTVMLLRFADGHAVLSRYLPAAIVDLLQAPWFAHAASVMAIASELFIALGPWFARIRPIALWLGVVFHLGIELSANVELFSYTMLSGYVAFVTPELRERKLTLGKTAERWLVRLRRLDFLSRFELQVSAEQSERLVVRDRQGRSHRGLPALRELARGIPLLYPLWLPLALVTWRKR